MAVQHIYQRSLDKGVIFYSTSDRLVYYTISSVKAKKWHVRVSAAAIMYTHLHQSAEAESLVELRGYLHDVGTSFSKQYNARYGRVGRLFARRPGRSQKVSLKEKRSNLIYVYNNHVEKGLCRRAVEERWSLLAYAFSDHPFSPPIQQRSMSRALARATKLVVRRVAAGKPLDYGDLDAISSRLDAVEWQQFIDFVIVKYALVDYGRAESYFGTMENLLVAVDSTTGGEYDIAEDYSRDADTGYRNLARAAQDGGYLSHIFSMSEERRNEVVRDVVHLSLASPHQVRKFFHLEKDGAAEDCFLA